MSVFGVIRGVTGQPLAVGGHRLASGDILRPTDPNAVTPTNPGTWSHMRSVPVVPAPRYFNRGEAAALTQLANQKQQQVTTTRQAYKALRNVERADASTTELHRGYQRTVANVELRKKGADVGLANHLHGQRTQYAILSGTLQQADGNATTAIGGYMATVKALMGS